MASITGGEGVCISLPGETDCKEGDEVELGPELDDTDQDALKKYLSLRSGSVSVLRPHDSGLSQHERRELLRQQRAERILRVSTTLGWLFVFVAIYDFFAVPYRTVFSGVDVSTAGRVVTDIISDIVSFLRIIVFFNTPFVRQGVLVDRLSFIARRYCSTFGFVVDVVIALPTGGLSHLAFHGAQVWRLNKIIAGPMLWLHWVQGNRGPSTNDRISKVTIPILMLLHLFACAWELVLKDNPSISSAITVAEDAVELAPLHRWCLGLDWALKHLSGYGSTGRFPRTDAQVALMGSVAVVGAFIYAMLLALVTAQIVDSSKRNPRERLTKKLDDVTDAMKDLDLPKSFRELVKAHYYYVFRMAGTVGNSDILDDLPAPLLTRVKVELGKSTLSKLQFFSGIDDSSMIADLSECLVPRVLLPDVCVSCAGDRGDECIFVVSGDLVEVSDTGEEIRYLTSGDRYGERALLSPIIRETSLVTRGLCTLFVLHRADLQLCMKTHPSLLRKILKARASDTWRSYFVPHSASTTTNSGDSEGAAERRRSEQISSEGEIDAEEWVGTREESDADNEEKGKGWPETDIDAMDLSMRRRSFMIHTSLKASASSLGSFLFAQGDASTMSAAHQQEESLEGSTRGVSLASMRSSTTGSLSSQNELPLSPPGPLSPVSKKSRRYVRSRSRRSSGSRSPLSSPSSATFSQLSTYIFEDPPDNVPVQPKQRKRRKRRSGKKQSTEEMDDNENAQKRPMAAPD